MCGIHVSLNQQVVPPSYSPCSQKPMEIPNTFLSPQSQQLHILHEKLKKVQTGDDSTKKENNHRSQLKNNNQN